MTEVPRADRRLPRHVGIIMDGNGRWAKNRGLPRIEGHRVGADSVRDVVRFARQIGLDALTLYAFSAENWARPADEVRGLMELLRDYVIEERAEIMDNHIRLRAVGEIGRLPSMVSDPLDALIADSAGNDKMALTLALSYGGRASIAEAAQRAVAAVQRGELALAALDADALEQFMPLADLPPLDLLIRTSGEQRVSNFMLWELAYAELYFTETLWPDFRREQLDVALDEYARRERRFGLTGDQVAGIDTDLGPGPGRTE